MHFPCNLLCKQLVFLPATKCCALLLMLQGCLKPAAQQPSRWGGASLGRFSAGLSSADSSAACNEAMHGDPSVCVCVCEVGMD